MCAFLMQDEEKGEKELSIICKEQAAQIEFLNKKVGFLFDADYRTYLEPRLLNDFLL